MNLPFSIDTFLDVFVRYNVTVWPMQVVMYVLGAGMLILACKKSRHTDRIIGSLLAFYWLWIGIVYHLIFFTSINKAAYAFGVLFIIQAYLFLAASWEKNHLSFQYRTNLYGITSLIFIVYALVIYPLLSVGFGHVYPKTPTFGLPCPTTIFTFGMLLWTDQKVPKDVLIIPVLWSFIGFGAAISLSIYQDYGLIVAGVVGTLLILVRDRKMVFEEKNTVAMEA